MTTFALIHGAGDGAWSWHLVEAELLDRGHEVVAVDLPSDDDAAGLTQYADTVVEAIGDRDSVVVVGHSFGGFTAPLVADRTSADLLVLVAGMIPKPGEAPQDWWENSGFTALDQAQYADDDGTAQFLHDVPPELAAEAMKRERAQSQTPMGVPWPLEKWPSVPTKLLIGRDDRFFPPEFSRGVAQERLGITPDEIDGSHCVALSRPKELAERLVQYASESQAS
ncbi:Pyrethroid hydrolase [Streptomyces sp. YIM 130001]|uniref:alpha/beta hydrolase n=1 Tax=Streptomyces sp. YIM 130001 TaxID=2259644 RepID=UPI000E658813|nr:alpha/beta hydrolase [Streptomyces sp. YIM 130001]RII07939.1 Pyrethroid hydrolase [Streptomyces sp. YIM 130001]